MKSLTIFFSLLLASCMACGESLPTGYVQSGGLLWAPIKTKDIWTNIAAARKNEVRDVHFSLKRFASEYRAVLIVKGKRFDAVGNFRASLCLINKIRCEIRGIIEWDFRSRIF